MIDGCHALDRVCSLFPQNSFMCTTFPCLDSFAVASVEVGLNEDRIDRYMHALRLKVPIKGKCQHAMLAKRTSQIKKNEQDVIIQMGSGTRC